MHNNSKPEKNAIVVVVIIIIIIIINCGISKCKLTELSPITNQTL